MQTISKVSLRQRMNLFLADPKYIALLALITLMSFLMGTELLFYGLVAFLVAYVCIFGDDLLPLAPVFGFTYIMPGIESNPGKSGNTVFSGYSLLCVIVVGAIVLVCFAYRIIRDRKKFSLRNNKLLPGLLALCVAYMLSGIFSEGYAAVAQKNLLFAAGQCIGVLLPYWLISAGVDWKKVRKDYLAWTGVGIGCVLLCEILRVYYINDVLTNGVILRERLFVGWGMYNNIGCMMAMMIPFAFCLGIYYKRGVLGVLGGAVFLLGVFLTCSRTSIIFGTVCYVTCVGLMLFYTRKRKRWTVSLLIVAAVLILLVVLLHKPLIQLYDQVLDDASELGSRFWIYKNGWTKFTDAPIFGTTFYPGQNLTWGWASSDVRDILPDRWHNTPIQLLASTGVVGLLAYGFHRVQTIRLAMRLRTREKWLVTGSVLTLLACSLLDCHFFNVGPTLFYSVTLAFLEKQE